ncbi:ceramide synthase 2-like isoform X1 [Mytilus galloprovincialis]|uniref:ceramide synthase 2-like isoform X1 n=1 Tax=Mytilus galloprovincialis TaxID=29158 RepID=UPI003F7B8C5B
MIAASTNKMEDALDRFSKWFWNPNFWLPVGYTWEDLVAQTSKDEYYPRVEDIFLPSIVLGVCLLVFRYCYARLVVIPMGRYLGIKEPKKYQLKQNPVLETAFKKYKSKVENNLTELSKRTSMSERQILRWMRTRAKLDAPSVMMKFEDTCWHFLFYIVLFWYGLFTLWDKSWFVKTENCWVGWPKQHVTNDVYWYYAIELGFYWSLLFTLSTDHKRKDFTEMVTHHVVTIFLVFFSWVTNFVRIGTLVLCVHDAVDYFLAGGKIGTYMKSDTLATILFVMFLLVWIASRLIIFPFFVIYSASVESRIIQGVAESSTYMFFNGLLYILQVLHIIWSYMIFRIAYRKVTRGKIEDVRSDSEEDKDELSEGEDYKGIPNNVKDNSPRARPKFRGDKGYQ